ncbi:uncharacterized protein LOC142230665 [Haematobia irritans]|uniref:uncharacterized protein LOC142230665 n=1 Tax=Haematobia irritans TaxID=7368 RepID=UPI003F509BBB
MNYEHPTPNCPADKEFNYSEGINTHEHVSSSMSANLYGAYSNEYGEMASVSSSPTQFCGGSTSSNANMNLELMHMNGRKVLGPPEDWIGPAPNSVCELFVRRIPREFNEQKLLGAFLRFGKIYEIRLPMDFNQSYRGYAYIKYTNEEDAACAMEVLSHYYIMPRRKLEIMHSYEKCRLFVTNIPKHLDEHEIEEKLRTIFPSMERMYTRPCSSNSRDSCSRYAAGSNSDNGQCDNDVTSTQGNLGNRGHVFIHFPSHVHALAAKKSITPGIVRMWDRDLKVVWANTERDCNSTNAAKTLFVRNVDLTVNNRDIIELLVKHVPRTSVCKISKVRQTAFLDFTTREAAEVCLKQLQGVVLRGKRLDVEWAKPSEQQSLHRMRETDYDAVLRLKCIANGWHIPIIIFGCYYENERLQYGAVVLRDDIGNVRSAYCIMHTSELVDIHSRMCEVVCSLIETIGGFPDYDYVFVVEKDSAHLLGMVTITLNSIDFMASCGVPADFYFDLNELIDLCGAVVSLSYASEEAILTAYKESFLTQNNITYLNNWSLIDHRVFGTIMPKYRNKDPLKHNLNDTQIVLVLCFKASGTNTAIRPFIPFQACNFDQGYEGLRYVILKLLPMALTQSRFVVSHVLSHVVFGGTHYYHPAQRIMHTPLWISGCSYAESIKQPNANKRNTCQTISSNIHQNLMNLTTVPQNQQMPISASHLYQSQTLVSPIITSTTLPQSTSMTNAGGYQMYPQYFEANPTQFMYGGYSLP